MYEGKIKLVMESKGYGFITREGVDKDLFFHISGVKKGTSFKDLKEGDNVVFEDIVNNGKGDAAQGVELA